MQGKEEKGGKKAVAMMVSDDRDMTDTTINFSPHWKAHTYTTLR
jgi:DNA gyrase inhibitor GyrI